MADRLKTFFLGPANMAKLDELEQEYMQKFPGLIENYGSTGVFSDARHATATNMMSDRLGGIPYVSDVLANLGGAVREIGGFAAEMNNPALKGSSIEDIRANALSRNYPPGTPAEEIYADIFSKAAAQQNNELAEAGFNYGTAQAGIPDDQINLPGEATAYLASQGYDLGSSAAGSASGSTPKYDTSDSYLSSASKDDAALPPQLRKPETNYFSGIVEALNPDEETIINRLNAANPTYSNKMNVDYGMSVMDSLNPSEGNIINRINAVNPNMNQSYLSNLNSAFSNNVMVPPPKPDLTLGDSDDAFDFEFKVDAPFGINPLTGKPYQTPRTIADQNRVLGRTFTEKPKGLAALFRNLSRIPTPFNLARGFLDAVTGPRRETTGIVYDDRGRGYTPAELNKMNAKGGYYSEPAREQRRREKRVENLLARKAAGKSYSQKNLNRLTTGGSKPGTYTTPGSGNAGSPGGGKSIVCTAMYQTTGLQDWKKAMKIWYIYQKKHLTDTHQEGYHWLFKPFVKAMKKSKIVEALGAHVAKHRTQELKHVLFNSKSDKLGKVYNMILEPICFIAGKIKSALRRG